MERWQNYLAQVKQQDLYRQTHSYEPINATHVRWNERVCLMLASNNYLGLTHHTAVQQAAADAALKYGTGSGGARLTTGTHPLFLQLEERIAAFKGTEAALVFNTGYMANVGIISTVVGPGDVIFSDELNHASIIDGCRLSRAATVVYRHNDMAHLAKCLQDTPCQGERLIVTDGVFSMDGDIAPLGCIVELAERYGALVMVDDAHATGVIGPGGHGTAAHFGLQNRVHIQMGTLSKALGSEGGFVAGSQTLIEYLVNRARSFIFSTALSPASMAAAAAALEQLTAAPEMVNRLAQNSEIMRRGLREAGLQVEAGETPIIPVLIGEAGKTVELATALKAEGLILSAIRPPTVPVGASRLRLTVSAAHDPVELQEAVQTIVATARILGVIR